MVIVALVCSLAVAFLLPRSDATENADTDALATRIAELEEELEEMRAVRDAGPTMGQPEAASFENAVRSEDLNDLVSREVQRYFQENPVADGGVADAGDGGESGPLTEEAKQELLASSVLALLDPQTSWEDSEGLWKQLTEAGLMYEAIELLEAEVERDPSNIKALVELADAYLQPIMQGEAAGMDAGKWSMKADQTYDAALSMDDHNWEARFSKAVSLSFWPPVFGKQPEAIRQFETLVSQQAEGPSQSHHVETYVLLGNLYQQSGQTDKATELWSKALVEFPNDERLLSSLGLQ